MKETKWYCRYLVGSDPTGITGIKSEACASVSDTHTLLNMRSLAHSLFCTPALNTTAAAIPPNTICSCESHKY
ncbi:hypothetical protein BLNAU_2037 [Blattamonas nauphoetae]|uniref:Uncharacterized protein n=1 Tax=Blattamonas nauphoetae TaxID=2049346 RepID=A0ABQ9YGZ0_9EUKA|nr:hypothetical protein BLNAU_2037 [Blattamonas nauphoetae]